MVFSCGTAYSMYKLVLTFEPVDEILKCHHSNIFLLKTFQQYFPVVRFMSLQYLSETKFANFFPISNFSFKVKEKNKVEKFSFVVSLSKLKFLYHSSFYISQKDCPNGLLK